MCMGTHVCNVQVQCAMCKCNVAHMHMCTFHAERPSACAAASASSSASCHAPASRPASATAAASAAASSLLCALRPREEWKRGVRGETAPGQGEGYGYGSGSR